MSAAHLVVQSRDRTARLGKSFARLTLVCLLAGGLLVSWTNPRRAASQTAPVLQSQASATGSDAEQLRKKVQQLNAEVARLKKRVADLEKGHQVDVLRDKLRTEQQHAEGLHAQLLATIEKQTTLHLRRDQIDEQLLPRNIDNMQLGGSLDPAGDRDAIRRRLGNERKGIQSQLDLLRQDNARLQASLVDSDAAIESLRLRLNHAALP